jgi:hypothetical protein
MFFNVTLHEYSLTHKDDSEYVVYVRSIVNVRSCYHGEADRPILLPTPDHHKTCLDVKNEDVANIISHCFPPGCRPHNPSAQYNTFTYTKQTTLKFVCLQLLVCTFQSCIPASLKNPLL